MSANGIIFVLAVIVMLQKIPMIWLMSTYKIYQIENSFEWLIIGFVFAIMDILLKIYLVNQELFKKLSD